MSNGHLRTAEKAATLQNRNQDRVIRSRARVQGNFNRDTISADREMMQGYVEQRNAQLQVQSPKQIDAPVFVEKPAQAPVQTLVQTAATMRSRPNAQRQNSPPVAAPASVPAKNIKTPYPVRTPIKAPGPAKVVQGVKSNKPCKQSVPVAVPASEPTAAFKDARPRVVRAHGISNNPSGDARRAFLLEQKLREMSNSTRK